MDDEPTENELLDEILATIPPPYNAKEHVIAADLVRERGMVHSTALRVLRGLVQDGKLREVEVILPTGQPGSAFVRA